MAHPPLRRRYEEGGGVPSRYRRPSPAERRRQGPGVCRSARERGPPGRARRRRDDRPPRRRARVQPGGGGALRLSAGRRPRARARRAHPAQDRPAQPQALVGGIPGGCRRRGARPAGRGDRAERRRRRVPGRGRDHAARAVGPADLHRVDPRPRRPKAKRGARARRRGALQDAGRAASARGVRRRHRRRELQHLLEPAGRGAPRILPGRVEARSHSFRADLAPGGQGEGARGASQRAHGRGALARVSPDRATEASSGSTTRRGRSSARSASPSPSRATCST